MKEKIKRRKRAEGRAGAGGQAPGSRSPAADANLAPQTRVNQLITHRKCPRRRPAPCGRRGQRRGAARHPPTRGTPGPGPSRLLSRPCSEMVFICFFHLLDGKLGKKQIYPLILTIFAKAAGLLSLFLWQTHDLASSVLLNKNRYQQ